MVGVPIDRPGNWGAGAGDLNRSSGGDRGPLWKTDGEGEVDGERHNIMRRSLAVKDGGMKYGDLKEVSLGGEVAGLRGGIIMGCGSGRKKMQMIYYKYNDS